MTPTGRRSPRGIAFVVGACAALVALPAAAGAQSAVDEYTLDIPGGGGSPSANAGGPPSAGAAGSGGGGTGSGAKGRAQGDGDSRGGVRGARGQDASGAGAGFAPFHEGVGAKAETSPRSAPEVVADTLFDGAMLPLLGALVLITGVGAWRVLRHRRTLTGAAG